MRRICKRVRKATANRSSEAFGDARQLLPFHIKLLAGKEARFFSATLFAHFFGSREDLRPLQHRDAALQGSWNATIPVLHCKQTSTVAPSQNAATAGKRAGAKPLPATQPKRAFLFCSRRTARSPLLSPPPPNAQYSLTEKDKEREKEERKTVERLFLIEGPEKTKCNSHFDKAVCWEACRHVMASMAGRRIKTGG